MNWLNLQRVRLLSHITFGKMRTHYREKYKKNSALERKLLESVITSVNHISSMVNLTDNILSYTRVPGFDNRLKVYDFINNIVRCSTLHKEAFGPLRFVNYGRDVVVCATGPTFDYFDPIPNAFYIGVNHAFRTKKPILFDVLFCQDVVATGFGGKVPLDMMLYRGKKCHKFFGNATPISLETDPRTLLFNHYMADNSFNYRIDIHPLPDFTSVIFSAFSFALWTTPKRIFIVGADCSSGHAVSLNTPYGADVNLLRLVEYWEQLKKFASWYYPDIEIFSVNPIGLKGLFNDIYTENFLAEHPEIDRSSVEILKIGENK